jgi:leucyl aminopeptidase
LAGLAAVLPRGSYHLAAEPDPAEAVQLYLGWGLGTYRFKRYKRQAAIGAKLILPREISSEVQNLLEAQNLVRDLINTPTEDMGPDELENIIGELAVEFGGTFRSISGKTLLDENFPAIHAVGRASHRLPRLVHMHWGEPENPRIALVGKGVCFDTGGLDIKSAAGMGKMKKDMGGAAHVIALARLIMQHSLPVQIDLWVPAVENSIAGNAYRPGDIISTRKGLSVEIGNTDAEGRVILCDALTRACEDDPELIFDFATLTGAARVALGTDLPPLFCNDLEVARAIQDEGDCVQDPLWTMPLYAPYAALLNSPVADLNNISKSSFGGCITAALYLQEFVAAESTWAHIDTYGWNDGDRPGRPGGGEALGLRAVFSYLQDRYAG